MTWYANLQVNLNWPESIQYIIVLIFIKKDLFDLNDVFTSYSGYLWTCQDNWVTLNQLSYGLNFFLLEKTWAMLK
jgi:hypothetical protein